MKRQSARSAQIHLQPQVADLQDAGTHSMCQVVQRSMAVSTPTHCQASFAARHASADCSHAQSQQLEIVRGSRYQHFQFQCAWKTGLLVNNSAKMPVMGPAKQPRELGHVQKRIKSPLKAFICGLPLLNMGPGWGGLRRQLSHQVLL